jgi:hypothetical protein
MARRIRKLKLQPPPPQPPRCFLSRMLPTKPPLTLPRMPRMPRPRLLVSHANAVSEALPPMVFHPRTRLWLPTSLMILARKRSVFWSI